MLYIVNLFIVGAAEGLVGVGLCVSHCVCVCVHACLSIMCIFCLFIDAVKVLFQNPAYNFHNQKWDCNFSAKSTLVLLSEYFIAE